MPNALGVGYPCPARRFITLQLRACTDAPSMKAGTNIPDRRSLYSPHALPARRLTRLSCPSLHCWRRRSAAMTARLSRARLPYAGSGMFVMSFANTSNVVPKVQPVADSLITSPSGTPVPPESLRIAGNSGVPCSVTHELKRRLIEQSTP